MFKTDQRVQFTEDLVIEAMVEITDGETGRIEATSEAGDVWVRLDRVHPELAVFDNCLWLPNHFDPALGSASSR